MGLRQLHAGEGNYQDGEYQDHALTGSPAVHTAALKIAAAMTQLKHENPHRSCILVEA
jgi:hypothetical protein